MTTTPLTKQLGDLLTGARTKTGRSRRKLAEDLHVTDVTLFRYEHGEANPTLAKAQALAAQYGLELEIRARKIRAPKA